MTKAKECLREMISILRKEDPKAFTEILKTGKDMVLGVKYGPDNLIMQFVEDDIIVFELSNSSLETSFRCSLEPWMFFDLLEGRVTLADAIWSRALDMIADVSNLLRAYRIMELALAAIRGSPAYTTTLLKLKNSSLVEQVARVV
ncbi:MAG: hypothetical protein HYU02_05475 [Thaumarchaeota archaeon]|nr:hypothetical protein [Nitrososphaerota archaeon]